MLIRQVSLCVVVAGGLLAAAASASNAAEPASGFENFITTHDAQLYDGAQRLRFVSWNIPNLIAIEDALDFLGESPWRWPDEFEIADALESVRQMGGSVARTYVITVRREGSDMGDTVHVLGPGEFNEEAFVALDRVLQIANEKQVRIILPLVDNWKWMGGVEQYAAFRGKEAEEFWTDRQLIDDFKATVRHVVNRRNTLTGQLYRDDKAILAWETGNELDAPPEWTAEIAAYIKQLDPNHLVIDGRSLHGVPEPSLDDPNVDVVTTHHYPGPGRNIVEAVQTAAATARGKKAYFVGEVGFVPLEEAARVFDAVIDEDASGALYWSLRFHRREGGFYWHDEPAGGNTFKAYHWPGFDSGDAYRERELLQTLVAAARRIEGSGDDHAAPPRDQPLAPARLLPIEHPGRISWQGSAGASGYDVQRAPTATGPWETVGVDVSDAAVQYRPLFCDDSVRPGESYYYRVIARRADVAGPPSNCVGPVAVDKVVFVDEMQDRSRLASTAGRASFRSDHARRSQEDMHRLELAPGASVDYEMPGNISAASVWVFADQPAPSCSIAVSADGEVWDLLAVASTSPARSGGDYGYLRPVLLNVKSTAAGRRFLRIANDAEADGSFQISRVEIAHDGAKRTSSAVNRTSATDAAPAAGARPKPEFVKGVSWGWVGSRGDYAGEAAARSIDELAATGAEWICIAFATTMPAFDTPHFGWGVENPRMVSDDEIRRAIALARQHGLKVILKPVVNCDDNEWRAWIRFYRPTTAEEQAAGLAGVGNPWGDNPGRLEGMTVDQAKWDAWWDNFRGFLLHYAELAAEQDVELFCLGCEMSSTESAEARWRALIGEIRARYDGLLTYDINHGRETRLTWWDAVDVIGVSAYYAIPPLGDTTAEEAAQQTTSLAEMKAHLAALKPELAAISATHGKPILFIETGVTNVRGCARYPWTHPDAKPDSPLDETEQANYYAAMLDTFWGEPWFMGYAWWDWPARLYDRRQAGEDRSFCIYGKAAESVLRQWYAKPTPVLAAVNEAPAP